MSKKRKVNVYRVFINTALEVQSGEVASALKSLLKLNPAKKVHFESVEMLDADYCFYREDGTLMACENKDKWTIHI